MSYYLAYKEKNENTINPIKKISSRNILDLVDYTTSYDINQLKDDLVKKGYIPNIEVELFYTTKQNKNGENYKIIYEIFTSLEEDLMYRDELQIDLEKILKSDEGQKFIFAEQLKYTKYPNKMSKYIKDLFYNQKDVDIFLSGFLKKSYSEKLNSLVWKFGKSETKKNYSKRKALLEKIIDELINNPFNLVTAFSNDFKFIRNTNLEYEIDMYYRIFNEQDKEINYSSKVSRYLSGIIYERKNGQYVKKDGERVLIPRKYFHVMLAIVKYHKYEYIQMCEELKKANQQRCEDNLELLKNDNNDDDEYLELSDFERIGENPEDVGYTRRTS